MKNATNQYVTLLAYRVPLSCRMRYTGCIP
jgi:hypothetical protein